MILRYSITMPMLYLPPTTDDAKTGGHDAERADRGAEGQRRMEVLARHRHPRSRHPHPRLGAQKVRTLSSALIGPNILSELSAQSKRAHRGL